MIVNFFSPDGRYDDIYLSNFATIYVKDELLRVYGVSDINYMGQRDYSIRAWLDPQKLASRNMTAMDVANAIRTQNLDAPAGQIGQSPAPEGTALSVADRHPGPAHRPGAVRIDRRQGRQEHHARAGGRHRPPARRRPRRAGRAELQPVVHLRRPPVRRPLASTSSPAPTRSTSPTGCAPRWRSSRRGSPTASTTTSPTTRRRTSASRSARSSRPCATRCILVGLVVLVFLQDWQAMILPMIDVPVSLIGTFAVMAALGFSLNNLTLFGLVLAIGIVVDDAIVVLENTERMIAKGYDARTATIKAMEEITGPIIAITLALWLGVRPVLLHRRDHRPVLPPVRGDDRRLDDHLGGQRPDDDAVAGRADLQDRGRGAWRHELKREALPWWIFGVLGGLLDRLVRASTSWPAGSACRRIGRGRRGRGGRRAVLELPPRSISRPGCAGRPGGRLVDHPAGERRAGLAVPRLQPAVRRA